MYKNLKERRIGGFSNGMYWSSSKTELQTFDAWQINFSDGKPQASRTTVDGLVRAVRRF
jgi:hypothetical protein